MSEAYKEEINKSKARIFFKKVLKDNCQHLVSTQAIEPLVEILTNKLVEKLGKENKWVKK